jgi:hypothetical protein
MIVKTVLVSTFERSDTGPRILAHAIAAAAAAASRVYFYKQRFVEIVSELYVAATVEAIFFTHLLHFMMNAVLPSSRLPTHDLQMRPEQISSLALSYLPNISIVQFMSESREASRNSVD